MTAICVTGATGRMGQTVISAINARDDVSLAMAVSREPDAVTAPQVVTPAAFAAAISESPVEVVVDFTLPEPSVAYVEAASRAGIASVVGTTGYSEEQRASLEAAAEAAPVLVAPNFSRGIQATLAAIDAILTRMPTADIEITETHHQQKLDAPSGTAGRLAEAIEAHRPNARRVHGRHGEHPRQENEIGIHARRAGSVSGEHEILIAGADEEVKLIHRAGSRNIFATGALDAATWIAGRDPGWYRFADVVTD